MSLFRTETLVGHLLTAWSRGRAVARLTEELERASDRRLADLGVARADIAKVALAAYPSRALAAAELRVRSPFAFAGVASHG